MTAPGVPWPAPVAPSEPYSSIRTRATSGSGSVVDEMADEASCGPHRPDRMRTRRPDSYREQIKDGYGHRGQLSANWGFGVTSTLGGRGDGSGCLDLRMIENATAPTPTTAAPAAASTSGRGRRLGLRASAIT